MKSNLRILFMGTPDFAVHILDAIVKAEYNVVGVVSVPDKPAGRGQKMHASAVAKYAKKQHLNLLQPEKLKSKRFVEILEAMNIDVSVVVAFRMLPKAIWELPNLGTFNLHASLLPAYRGAAPINWAIMNGETKTGVTTFLIDEKIDTGNILLQAEVDILKDDNAGTLHDKLMHRGAELVLETLEGLENKNLIPQPQKETDDILYANKIFKEDCLIDWNQPIDILHDFIRGLSPYPVAWTYLKNDGDIKILKIYDSVYENRAHTYANNQIFVEDKRLGIGHKEGIIWLNEVQLEGKRKMKALDFVNGHNLSSDAQVTSNANLAS